MACAGTLGAFGARPRPGRPVLKVARESPADRLRGVVSPGRGYDFSGFRMSALVCAYEDASSTDIPLMNRHHVTGLQLPSGRLILAMACQWKINPTQPVLSQIDKGRENQRLKSEKQIIQPATALLRSLRRSCLRNLAGDPRRCRASLAAVSVANASNAQDVGTFTHSVPLRCWGRRRSPVSEELRLRLGEDRQSCKVPFRS